MTASTVYLCTLRSFSEHLFYGAPLRNCLFHVQVAVFHPADTVKINSQVLFKDFIQEREVAIQTKAFIYLKSLKFICEEVNS